MAGKGIAWATLNQIVCALRFLYGVTLGQDEVPERIPYARKRGTLPEVLSRDEVVRFLEAVPGLKCRIALTKSQVLSSVGLGADIGLHPISAWNNPEPEIVLAVSSRGKIVARRVAEWRNLHEAARGAGADRALAPALQ